MKPGPKPSPANVVALKGGSQTTHRPLPGEIKTDVEVPACPAFVRANKCAKKHWDYIVHQLKRYELISRLDQAALVGYCTAYAHFQMAEEMIGIKTEFDGKGEILNHGLIQATPQGYSQVSPWWVIRNKALEQMIKIGDLFGMTPSGRVRINPINPNQGQLNFD